MTEVFEGAGGGGSSRSPSRTPDNLLSQDYAEIILGLGKGPWKGLVPGVGATPENPNNLQNFFLGDTPLQNPATNESNFKDFKVTQYKGEDGEPNIERVLGGDASNIVVGVNLSQGISVTRTTPSSLRKTDTNPGFNRLEVRLLFNRLVRTDDNGDYNHTATFKIEYKASNSSTWVAYQNPSTVTGKTTSGYVKDFLIEVTPLTNADYDIRVTKLSADNGTQEIVDMTWESIQVVTLARPAYPGLAKIHIYGRVSQQFSSLPTFSGIYDGQIVWIPSNYNPVTRTYAESTPWNGPLVKGYTNNPAWLLYWLIMDQEEGLAHYYLNVAALKQEFYEAGKWCDEQVPSGVPGVTQPRFTFNAYLDTQKLGLELLTYVAGSFGSTIFDDGNGVIRLKTDAPKIAKQLFTPETVENAEFNYSFTDVSTRYNEITVQFINPDLNWSTDERVQSIDASQEIAENGLIPTSFQAVGCTNVHEAIRRANDRWLTANTEVATVTFDTTRFGMNAELYDTILIADPTSGWSTGGRIKSYKAGTIELRDPVFVETVAQTTLKIQTFTGLVELGVTPPSTGLVYSLSVTNGTFPSNVPDRAQFTLENTTNFGLAKPFRVVGITEIEGDINKWRITACEINLNKYADSAAGTVSTPIKYDYTTPGEPVVPAALVITNLPPQVSSDGTLVYRVRASWEVPFQANTDHYEVDYEEVNTGTTKTEIVYGDQLNIENLKDGNRYNFRLWTVSYAGRRSETVREVLNWLIPTKTISLENVANLSLTQTNKGWLAQWNPPFNIPDIWGTRIKTGTPATSYESLTNKYFSLGVTQDLPWLPAGTNRIFAKYINTSENESAAPAIYDQLILAPQAPTVTSQVYGVGSCEVIFTNPQTSQPLKHIRVKKGSNSSTWNTANLADFTIAANQRSITVTPDGNVTTRLFIAGVDLADNEGTPLQVNIAVDTGVSGIIEAIRGDIDETWITPSLLDHINFGDTSVPGSLPNQIRRVEANSNVFEPFLAWQFTNTTDGWVNYYGTPTTGPVYVQVYSGGNSNENIIYRTFSGTNKIVGSLNRIIRVRLKRTVGTSWVGNVFYGVDNGHGESASFFKQIPEPIWGADGWGLAEWDMGALTAGGQDWVNSVINYLRIDLGISTPTTYQIDWIAVGAYGPGISKAVFQEEIIARQSGDSANASQITTIQSTVQAVRSSGSSLWYDPAVLDPNGWIDGIWHPKPLTATFEDGATGWQSPDGQGASTRGTPRVLVTPGRRYKVSALFRRVGTPTGPCYLRFDYRDSPTGPYLDGDRGNGQWGGTGQGDGENFYPGTTWESHYLSVIPLTANYLAPTILLNHGGGGSGYYQCKNITIYDVTDTENLKATVQTEISTRASETGFLGAQWATRVSITSGGVPVVGGIAIAGYSTPTAGPTFDFSIRANKIAFLPPAGLSDTPSNMFAYYSTPTFLPNGLTIQPGLYLSAAYIDYVSASQIDTRGLTIKDAQGNVVFSAGGASYAVINDRPKLYRVQAVGSGAFSNGSPGLYNAENNQSVYSWKRSYSVVTIRRSDGYSEVNYFDVFGVGEIGGTATTMAAFLNNLTIKQYYVIVYTGDEPQGNRTTGDLPAAMYRHGASPAVFGSPNFQYRSAYILIGLSGCGEGQGFEIYRGDYNTDPNAYCEAIFQYLNGNLIVTGTGATPKLSDYGYTGALNATYGATFDVNVYGQINASNSTTFIAAAAIKSAMIDDLRTSNYAESGGTPTAGAKLSSTGTALKVASSSLQVGTQIFSDYWFRLQQAIDGTRNAALIWRGNNDTTTRGGAPNIDCLTIYSQSTMRDGGNFTVMDFAWKLQPGALSDNLDSMRQMKLDYYPNSGGSSPTFTRYVGMTDRMYQSPTIADPSNAAQGSFTASYRFGGDPTGQWYFGGAPYAFSGHILVSIYNAYGPSAQKWFHGVSNAFNAVLSADTSPPSGAPGAGSGGGGGGSGGYCPAPWVKITLQSGLEISASDLRDGDKLLAVNDSTLEEIPGGGIVRAPQIQWQQRIRLVLTNGNQSEWSRGHRFYVVSQGWTKIEDLRPGMQIAGMAESIVQSIAATGEGQVIAFMVEGAGTYFSTNLLCHNLKPIDP